MKHVIAYTLTAALLFVYFYVMAWMVGAAWFFLSDAFLSGMEAARWL